MCSVSIIVPNYNHAAFLHQRLDSIFNQSFQDFEVILLDDVSTDNSLDILREYAKNGKVSHFIANKTNSGSPFKQWEKGIKLAKGQYVWIAESDDAADRQFLEVCVKALKDNTALGLVFTNSLWVDGKNEIVNTWEFNKSDQVYDGNDFIAQFMTFSNPICNVSSMVFRKALFPSLVDTRFRFCGDWHIYMTMIRNAKIKYIAKPLNYFRKHSNTVSDASRNTFLHVFEGLQIVKELVADETLDIDLHETKLTWRSYIKRQIYYSILKRDIKNFMKLTSRYFLLWN